MSTVSILLIAVLSVTIITCQENVNVGLNEYMLFLQTARPILNDNSIGTSKESFPPFNVPVKENSNSTQDYVPFNSTTVDNDLFNGPKREIFNFFGKNSNIPIEKPTVKPFYSSNSPTQIDLLSVMNRPTGNPEPELTYFPQEPITEIPLFNGNKDHNVEKAREDTPVNPSTNGPPTSEQPMLEGDMYPEMETDDDDDEDDHYYHHGHDHGEPNEHDHYFHPDEHNFDNGQYYFMRFMAGYQNWLRMCNKNRKQDDSHTHHDQFTHSYYPQMYSQYPLPFQMDYNQERPSRSSFYPSESVYTRDDYRSIPKPPFHREKIYPVYVQTYRY